MSTLKNLQSLMAIGGQDVHQANISEILYTSGVDGRVSHRIPEELSASTTES